ncbi:MAG: hypothetical protein BA863_04000 [Desulfovibrio sp. S3730MH75]|nr:MAG: hypothetical protein BA863_04000 [Desulfovibrio sp. S3730MH75]
MASNIVSEFLFNGAKLDVDEADLERFIGSNYDSFASRFKKFDKYKGRFVATWNWPVLFVSFSWFLYRKMYMWAAISLVLSCIPAVGVVWWVGGPVVANHLYYSHCKKRISGFKEDFSGDEYYEAIDDFGGVNTWVVYVNFAIVALMLFGVIQFFGN